MKKLVLISSLCAIANIAMAGADCPKAEKSAWMTEHDFQKMAVNDLGYTIYKFKIDGDCYEIYGMTEINGEMKKAETYFDPVSGAIVKQEID